MKRKIAPVFVAALVLVLTACGAANDSDNTNNSPAQTESGQPAQSDSNAQASQNNGENSTENADNAENAGTGKILIAYFAVAENSDVDAVSSASVTEVDGEAKGLVRTVAEDIQTVTGGDLFSIETSVDYPGDINDLIEYASVEQDNDERPELTSHIENLDEYDTIQKLEPDATVISDGFTVSHETAAASVSDVAADVEEWLHGLGLSAE
ncbi:MAG: hypothetical protein Q4C58_01235 [Eubacteriales bacterium]|nr:hypothetical protein [Eubacteriales bacterium]